MDEVWCTSALTENCVVGFHHLLRVHESRPLPGLRNVGRTSWSRALLRIFREVEGCRETQLGEVTNWLSGDESMQIHVVSQTGDPVMIIFDVETVTDLCDCDQDGIPYTYEPKSVCSAAKVDRTNAISFPLDETASSLAFVTIDDASSCSPLFISADDFANVWFTHLAEEDGQPMISLMIDSL